MTTTTTPRFKPGDRVFRTGNPHGKLTSGKVYTVASARVSTLTGTEWITLEGVFYGGAPWEFLADQFSPAPVETKEELFTITQPWDLKPGDIVDTVPEPLSSAGVQVKRQVPVTPPAPLPPTTPGSFIIANGAGANREKPTVPLFLTRQGWVTQYVAGLGWTPKVIQQRGFTVLHDEGAKD